MAVSCAICFGEGVAVALSIADSEIVQHGWEKGDICALNLEDPADAD